MNKRLFYSRISAAALLVGAMLVGGCSLTKSASTTPNVGDMNIDLINFQAELMKNHPLLESGDLKNELTEDFASLRSSLTSETDTDDVVWELKKILAKLGDEHTHAYVSSEQDVIPIRFEYTDDGLVTKDTYKSLEKGALIQKIGSLHVADIISLLKEVTAKDHANVILGGVVERHLNTEVYLDHLGLLSEDGTVDIEYISQAGETSTISLPLKNHSWKDDVPYEYSFESNSSTGVFVIRNYIDRSKFEKVWAAFIEECRIRQPDNILIDLRKSTGGYSEYYMTDAIFSSLGIKEYRTTYPQFYKDAFKKTEIVNVTKHMDPISIDNLYIATSNFTISAPTIFASIVKENDLGTIIGQPVANNLDFFASGSYQFEHMDIRAGISGYSLEYKGSEVETDAPLNPDVFVPTTAADIRDDVDPILKWIELAYVN